MKTTAKIAAAAMLGLSALAIGATSASAAIVCNAEGACWHVRHPYAYRAEYGVVVHPRPLALAPGRALCLARTRRPRLLA